MREKESKGERKLDSGKKQGKGGEKGCPWIPSRVREKERVREEEREWERKKFQKSRNIPNSLSLSPFICINVINTE